MPTPDLQALIELSDDDIERGCIAAVEASGFGAKHWPHTYPDADQLRKVVRAVLNTRQTAPTLPGAGGGDALDAARYRWLRANVVEGRMESRGPRPDFALNCDEPEWEWDAAIDAALGDA